MNARTSRSFWASASVKVASSSTVAKRSSLPSPIVCVACREVQQHLVAELALTLHRARRRAQEVVEGAVLVDAVGSERLGQVAQAGVDAVELDRDRGVGQLDLVAVGQGLAGTVVGGGQLHEPVGHQRRGHDDGLGVGRQPVVGVVLHLDPNGVARRRHGGDGADVDAQDPDVGAGEDADRSREARGDGPGLLVVTDEEERGCQQQHRRDHDEGASADPAPGARPRDGHVPHSPSNPGWNSPVGIVARLNT